MTEENLKELEMELLKMNIKRTQGLQAADAGKYRHLKKKIARLKDELHRKELEASSKKK